MVRILPAQPRVLAETVVAEPGRDAVGVRQRGLHHGNNFILDDPVKKEPASCQAVGLKHGHRPTVVDFLSQIF